jgi:hypothetical protein
MITCHVCKGYFQDSDCLSVMKDRRITPTITCRKCNKERCKQQYAKRREYYIRLANERKGNNILKARKFLLAYYMTHACVDCGIADYAVLQLDHVGDKRKSVSRMVHNGYPVSTIKGEIEKCQVRCVNCHRRKTAAQQNWSKAVDLSVK